MNEYTASLTSGKDYLDTELLFGTNESKYGEIKLSLADRLKGVPIKNIEIKEITYDVGPISVNLSTPINRPLVNMPFSYFSPFGKGIKCNLVYSRSRDGGTVSLGLKTSSILKNTGAILRVVITFGENIIEDVPAVEIVKNGKETRLETDLDVFLYDEKPNEKTERSLATIALLAKTKSIKCMDVLSVRDKDGKAFSKICDNCEDTPLDFIRERVIFDRHDVNGYLDVDISRYDGAITFVPSIYVTLNSIDVSFNVSSITIGLTFEDRDEEPNNGDKIMRDKDSTGKLKPVIKNENEVVENICIADSVICKGTGKYNIESVKELVKNTPLYAIEVESVIANGLSKFSANYECARISHNTYKIKIWSELYEPFFAYIQIAKDGSITLRSKDIGYISDILIKFTFLSKVAFDTIRSHKPTEFKHANLDWISETLKGQSVDLSKPFLIEEPEQPIPESGFVLTEGIVYKRSTPSIEKIFNEAKGMSKFNKMNKEIVKNGFRRVKTTILEDDNYIRYIIAFEK